MVIGRELGGKEHGNTPLGPSSRSQCLPPNLLLGDPEDNSTCLPRAVRRIKRPKADEPLRIAPGTC